MPDEESKHPQSSATRGSAGGGPPRPDGIDHTIPLKSCMDAFRESAAGIAELKGALWGGPHGKGLVHLVADIAKATEVHQKLLIGNGSEGIEEKVRRHEAFVKETRADRKWLIRLLVSQLVLILIAGAWVIIRVAAGG